MALVTEEPTDIPTTDALRDLEDPDNPPKSRTKAEIYLSGAHVATIDNAPNGRERITMMVELEVLEESVRFNENGDTEVPIRRCRRVGDMWPVGTPKPTPVPSKKTKKQEAAEIEKAAADDQPPLFPESGEVDDDTDPYEDDNDDTFDGGPDFSDGGAE